MKVLFSIGLIAAGLTVWPSLVLAQSVESSTVTTTASVAVSTSSSAQVVLPPPAPTPAVESKGRTVIVVGGARGGQSPTLVNLRARLVSADPETTVVVFTGNYTKKGAMPGKNSDKRERAEEDLRAHTDTVKDFVGRGGQVYFLAGHRDYTQKGRKSVRRLRKFLNKQLRPVVEDEDNDDDEKLDVMPSADCGEPTVIELGQLGVLALVNSQWWMQDWEKHARTNEGCEFKSRTQLIKAYEGVAKKYRTRRVLYAQHHPLESLGEYGGNFRFVEHLKPPVFGTIAIWGKLGGVVRQYRGHALYDSLVTPQLSIAEKYGQFIFLSGHDRSLQLLTPEKQFQVVAGTSGEKTTPVTSAQSGEYAESRPGWAEVQLDAQGEGRIVLFDGESAGEIFAKALPPMPKLAEEELDPAPPITVATQKSTYAKRDFGQTNIFQAVFLGTHYRNAYALQLEFPVLNLSEELGGLTPVKIGGGNQTNSLRLIGKDGGQWALRSTSKDSSRYLPYPANKVGFINYLLEDGFTATHPAAALAVVPMATALGIYHARPRLMYLPDQKGLGEFRGYITDELVLLERRARRLNEGELPDNLGGNTSKHAQTRYKSTEDMLDKMAEKPWKHQADQEAMLRARLFDIFLGDWDRHRDQWRFARIKQDDGTYLYKPIPRDRDQAFAHYDGLALFLGRMASPNIRVLRPFDDHIGTLSWLTYNARFIDAQLLNQVPRDRWMEIAKEVQDTLTDEVIDAGMATWSDEARELDAPTIAKKLRGRRDQLLEVAARFYNKINEDVEILGSEKSDLIDLTFVGDKQVKVEVRRKKKGPDSKPFYTRTLNAEHTDSVTIYGLAGKDDLVVHGKPTSAMQLRFLGGEDDDEVLAANGSKEDPLDVSSLEVYDRKKGIKIKKSIEVDEELSKSTYKNHYDRYDFHHEPVKFGGLPSFLINPDDGLYLGGSVNLTLSGFKRRPYASQHSLRAFFATSTLGVDAGYRGVFPELFDDIDQVIEVAGTTPTFTRNFFGFTNTFTPIGQSRDFFRLRQGQIAAKYALQRGYLNDDLQIQVQGIGQFVDVEDTAGRFVSQSPDVTAESLDSRLYAGARFMATLSTIDSGVYPKRGIGAQFSATVMSDVTPGADEHIGNSGIFTGALVTHIPFDRTQRFVLSTRARIAGIVGDYPFYFAPTVGDRDLRAYNAEQLSGNAVFAHSTDLRVEILRFKTGLPSAVGLSGGIDHGLAFGAKAVGSTYHAMAGGSVFWNILGSIGLGVGYYRGFRNGSRITVSVGPLFGATGFEQ